MYTFLGEIKAVSAQVNNSIVIEKSPMFQSRLYTCLTRKMDCFFGSLWAHLQVRVLERTSYFQMDVLDPHFARLCQYLKDSDDFTLMHEAHSMFLDAIEKHFWLRIPAIVERLQNVIQVCFQICRTLKIVDKDQMQKLDILAKDFDRDAHFLVQVWTALPDGDTVISLLSRLDFNHWYTFS